MTAVLYPYVYLLARAAFLEQSVCALEASRTLGRGPWRTFVSVALPLARPSIVAGLALVMMEALADFGTVKHFEVDTFTTGIYLSWFGMGSPIGAAKLAAGLLLFVLAVIGFERLSRGRRRYHHTTTRYRPLTPFRLGGWKATVAVAVCTVPILVGFLVPGGRLLGLAVVAGDLRFGGAFVGLARNSLLLAVGHQRRSGGPGAAGGVRRAARAVSADAPDRLGLHAWLHRARLGDRGRRPAAVRRPRQRR